MSEGKRVPQYRAFSKSFYALPQTTLRHNVIRDPVPSLGSGRAGQAEEWCTLSGGDAIGDFAPPRPPPPMPSNFNCRLGSERGHKPIREPGQAGAVPSSHCEKTAKAKRGRWGRGGQGHLSPSSREGGGGGA